MSMTKQPDKFEQFLVGGVTTRRFCELIGLDDFLKDLVNMLFGLRSAHDQIVARETKKLTLDLIRAYQQGRIGKGKRITDEQIAELLGLGRKEIMALDNLRIAGMSDPLNHVKELNQVTSDQLVSCPTNWDIQANPARISIRHFWSNLPGAGHGHVSEASTDLP